MTDLFIVFEGGEGAGKSTQESRLAAWLEGKGERVVRTREPGGTPAGEAIRAVLLGKDFEGLSDKAEALLFAASRGDHVDQVIRPQLEQGAIVLCDRYLDSSVAYQGYGRELGVERVRDLSLWATGGLLPDTVKLSIQWKLHGCLLPATVLLTNVTFVQVSLTEQPRCAPDFAPLLPTNDKFRITVGGYPTGSLSPVW